VTTTGGKRGGNLELDRIIPGLGPTKASRRIRRSLHSKDPNKLRRVNAIIDKLIEDDRWETLRALRDGDITVGDLIEADRKGQASKALEKVKLAVALWDRVGEDGQPEAGAVSRALAKVPGDATRKRYVTSFLALQQKGAAWLPATATVGDLADVPWDELAARWGATGTDWMHLRTALSRFLSLHLADKWDPFARKLRHAIPRKKSKKRRPNISIARFRTVVSHAPVHAAAAYWVLAITGLRLGEYLALTRDHLDAHTRTIDVPGTKTDGSEAPLEVDARWWPYIDAGVPPRLKRAWLGIHWRRACVAAGLGRLDDAGHYHGPTIHDLRHCHGQWAIDAGVAESKVQASLRHENPDQTRDYTLRTSTRDVSTALADAILGAVTVPGTSGDKAAPKRPASGSVRGAGSTMRGD
jgi:integrase